MTIKQLYVLNGPNLHRLGTREPTLYGTTSFSEIEAMTRECARDLGYAVEFRQTNAEGELIDWIYEADEQASAVIINPAGYTHTSFSIHDAIKAIDTPVIEVHIRNLAGHEPARCHSTISAAVVGVICGFGADGYRLAVMAAAAL